MADEIQAPSETEQAAILAQETPHHIQAIRNDDPARRVYGSTGMESVVPDNYFEGADLPESARKAAVQNLRDMLADTGLAPVEANSLFTRAGIVRSEGKSAEQQRKEARIELQRVFGDGAEKALADAKRLVQRDPRFSKWIEKKGLGNDPETLIQLARVARSQRAAGRLK